ncbi:hypothetical protein ACFSUK_35080 [Sphingobium scionense]
MPIDQQEVLQAARLIHWNEHDPAMRLAQVRTAAEILQKKMTARYARKLPIDGKSDTICAIVADIFHQGRSTFAVVKDLLGRPDPVQALLKVNDAAWSGAITDCARLWMRPLQMDDWDGNVTPPPPTNLSDLEDQWRKNSVTDATWLTRWRLPPWSINWLR